MIEQTYKLNMIPRAEQDFRSYEPPVVHISQYDKVLRTLRFELYDGKNPFTIPENTAAYIYGMKPDGNAFQYQMDITEDGLLQIGVQTQMATVAGCVTCEVILFEGNESGNRIGSANFKMAVEKAAVGDDAQFSESDMPVIQTLLFGGTPGDILVKDEDGVKWNSESLSVGYMRYDQYDPDRTGTVNSARQANNAATVDGHTVARNVLANEYTNEQIDESFRSVREEISNLDSVAVKSVNSIQPDQNGNVQLSKADIGLGNVDNTSDADKPISSAAQEALNQKVDKVPGMGLSQNSFTDTEKEKLGALPTSAELTAELSEKVDKEAGKGLSQENFTSAEKAKLANIAAGAEVNVQSDWTETDPESDAYIMHKPSIPSKTSDLTNDSGFVTDAAMQSALDQKVDKETGKGLSTNDFTNAEKTKLAGIEAGAQVNTITGVKGDAETNYRTGNVNITKANIGLGNVDNTSDADKPISTAVQTALDGKQATLTFDTTPTAGSTNPVTSGGIATEISALNSNLSQKVSSVNGETPDTNGNVSLNAENIPADGVGAKDVSGNPIIITDGVAENAQSLSVDFDPIQDLHGYDHPWAGGAGKNLLPMTVDGIKAANTTGTWDGNVYTGSNVKFTLLTDDAGNVTGININRTATGSSISFEIFNGSISVPSNCKVNLNASANNDNCDFSVRNGSTTIAYIAGNTFKTAERTLTGTTITRIVMHFNANFSSSESITVYPMLRLASETDPTFEPYSNICPITGRTQVDVTRTGKNLLEDNVAVGTYTNHGGTITRNSDYSYLINGTFSSTTIAVANMKTGDFSTITQNVGRKFISNGTYKISFGLEDADSETKKRIALQICQTNNASGNDDIVTTTIREGGEITIDDTYAYNWVRLYIAANTYDNLTIRPMIYLKSEADSSYEPYQGQSVTINLGQTVYGGTLNVTTGELTVETANIASYNGETIGEPWWSSMDEYVAGTTPTTGAQVVYTLATPTTVSLTPAQIALLEGYNILTTDGDNINLTYRGSVASNVQAEIDEFEESTRKLEGSLAMIETSPATANHAVGDYLMLNNRLCKVTSAIATGEQIIVGSNVQYTTVAEELTAILAQINA